MSAPPTSRLFLVDASGFLHRAYHALPPLTDAQGRPAGALFGFARVLLSLLKKEKPEGLVVCFDTPGPTFRDKLYTEYKANRLATEEPLKEQLGRAEDLVKALGLPVAAVPGFEADDLIATLAHQAAGVGWQAVLVTGDKDAMQLVGPAVRVMPDPQKGVVLDEDAVAAKYGLPPGSLLDYFTLVGDSVDNIPGAKGVGPVRATALLKDYGTLEGVFAALKKTPEAFSKGLAQNLRDFEPQAPLSRELLKLAFDAPVTFDPSALRPRTGPDAAAALTGLGFASLLKDLIPALPSPFGERVAEGRERVDSETNAQGELLLPSAPVSPPPPTTSMAPAAFLKKAQGAAKVSVAWLADDAFPALALGLPDGSVCVAEPAALKAVLEGPALKVGHDLKEAVRATGLRGPYFDTALAAWCLDATRGSYRFEDLCQLRLSRTLPAAFGPDGAARRAAETWALAEGLRADLDQEGLARVFDELEMPLLGVLASMEALGLGLDAGYLAKLSVDFETGIAALRKEIAELAGSDLNPASPKQVAAVLFGKLQLPAGRKTKTGYSTDEETLKALAPRHPLPAKLLEFREWTKLKGTYIDNLAGLAPGGRVHTTFNQTGTATGRLSSVNPNLQNIPIRSLLGQKIRRAFVPSKGCVFLAADYSQIDLRLLAHESGDPALVDAFKKGEDVHTRTACQIFGKAPGEVDAEDRRVAKAVNFGVVYGQTPHGLSQTLGIPMGQAQDFIKRYFERYAGVRAWIDAHLAEARKTGLVRTWMGRLRRLPELSSKNPNLRGFAERAGVNTTIQGGSADVIKKAMLDIAAGLERAAPGARMLLQVHDDLLFEVPEASLKATAAWVRERMEHAAELKVPLVVDLKAGRTWADLEKLPG